jgi:hypothetical protein
MPNLVQCRAVLLCWACTSRCRDICKRNLFLSCTGYSRPLPPWILTITYQAYGGLAAHTAIPVIQATLGHVRCRSGTTGPPGAVKCVALG